MNDDNTFVLKQGDPSRLVALPLVTGVLSITSLALPAATKLIAHITLVLSIVLESKNNTNCFTSTPQVIISVSRALHSMVAMLQCCLLKT